MPHNESPTRKCILTGAHGKRAHLIRLALSPGLIWAIEPVTSRTIITSVLLKLSWASHETWIGTSVKLNTCMRVVGSSTDASARSPHRCRGRGGTRASGDHGSAPGAPEITVSRA